MLMMCEHNKSFFFFTVIALSASGNFVAAMTYLQMPVMESEDFVTCSNYLDSK